MPDYDGLYHRLFSHPRMVAEMLREFVAGPWLDDLDLDGMERLNAKFHAETSERRDGDMIWRIPRRGGGDTYLVLLLEFQSTPDHWMALRALVYAGLLWQHLVAEKRLPLDGRLPPVLPVVLYNGDRRWTAPLALNELVGLPENSPLWRWQPHMRYHMVDEGAFGDEDLAERETLPALLFRLESFPDPEQIVGLADALVAWFVRHPGFEGLRAIFAEMLGSLMGPLAPGTVVPEELLECGICWRRGAKPGNSSGCKKAVRKARRRFWCVCLSAGSVRCRIGRKTASPPATPSRWKNGACVSLTPAALKTSWARTRNAALTPQPKSPALAAALYQGNTDAIGAGLSVPSLLYYWLRADPTLLETRNQ